jgi:thiol:disulfide interchange protein DsbD
MLIRIISVALIFILCLSLPAAAQNNFFDKFGPSSEQEALLADDVAFQILETRVDGKDLVIAWESAVDYYLYKKNFKVESLHPGVKVGDLILPKGKVEADPLFGDVEVYFGSVIVRAPLEFDDSISGEVAFNIHAQGCNKPVGICYPPQKRLISVSLLADKADATFASSAVQSSSEQNASSISSGKAESQDRSILVHILVAFGVGVLLVFTPWVLPMIPILSGMVVGHSTNRSKAVWLSIAYVLGTAITYTVMGVLAGAAGIQVQAYFQQPVFIAGMVLILLILAASMFGLFELRLPSRLQTIMTEKTNTLSKGGFIMSLLIGLLSALIVSACVSPLLILVLGVAVQQASPVLGGTMMFAMAWGMGIPLILFALGAHWLLPKAGDWMNRIKEFFGFSVIAVAIIVVSSIKIMPVLLLWAIWLLCLGYWLWRLTRGVSTKKGKAKAISVILRVISMLVLGWGFLSLLGSFYGGTQVLNPLDSVLNSRVEKIPFKVVKTVEGLDQLLKESKDGGKPVLVDYYADWCTECIRMEHTTYRDALVTEALREWTLIKVDVTKVSDETQAVKDFFGVFGPPATLFISAAGEEMKKLNRYGLIGVDEMLKLTQEVVDAK